MKEMKLRNYAYLGDAVWELYIREHTTELTSNAKHLHKITTERVKASYQAELLHKIAKSLTEAEQDLARRGRNLPIPVGRRSNQTEYRAATAFEVLIGWWYKEKPERLQEFFNGELKFSSTEDKVN